MEFRIVHEGSVKLKVPVHEKLERAMPVFYNVDKADDRSLSVALLRCYREMVGRDLVACDLLSATGVRGLRLACEVPGLRKVVINDVSPRAFMLMRENVRMNEGCLRCEVETRNEEANRLLWTVGRRFDYLDVDPFGSPTPFLDAAARSVRPGGILAVTSTDTACLCAVYPKTCFRKYGSVVFKTEYRKEVGVRILAKKVIEVGAQHCLALEPVFAYVMGGSFRVYFLVAKGARRADEVLGSIGFILHCERCLFRRTAHLGESPEGRCQRCQSRLRLIGPLFIGRLCRAELGEMMLSAATGRIRSLIKLIVDENAVGTPWYYTVSALSSRLKAPTPRMDSLIDALRQRGYSAVRTHYDWAGIKMNAPIEEVEGAFGAAG